MSRAPWFRVRATGLGWTPITWQGWLATVLGAAAFIAVDHLVLGRSGVFRR